MALSGHQETCSVSPKLIGTTATRASLVAQMVKNLPEMWETWLPSLGWEDPLEKGMATHSSILAWRIPMDRGAWQAIVHLSHTELDMTEHLSTAQPHATQIILKNINCIGEKQSDSDEYML